MTHRGLINRRSFLASGVTALVVHKPLTAAAADNVCNVSPVVSKTESGAEVAVSLREALKRAKTGGQKRLTGLTRIDVVCRDDDNDIILGGVGEKGQPDLYLDDLIVAIRSANRKYGKIEPGISLDPDRSQTPNLNQISGRDAAAKQQYLRVCSNQPQAVRVDALPRHSRVTKVLVEADYRMKQVSQGTLQLPVNPPLPGTFARRLEQSRQKLRDDDMAAEWSSRRRFWFEPGKFEYAHDYQIASLRSAQVILSDADGDAEAGAKNGNVDPIAREFACAWTARMEETFRAEPIWRDMYNIYRHFAIAHILTDQNFYSYELRQLIDAHEIDHVEVPDSLPGLGRWEIIEEAKGRRRLSLVSTVCGGVSLGFASRMTSNYIGSGSEKSPTQMALLKRAIFLSRPEKLSVSWTVPPTALQAAAKWYADQEEQRLKEARQREEDEVKRFNDSKKGLAFLGGLILFGCLAGWLMNRPRMPPAKLLAAGPDEPSAPLLRLPDELKTSMEFSGVRRNDLCPCNSGKRFKHCHGAHHAESNTTVPD